MGILGANNNLEIICSNFLPCVDQKPELHKIPYLLEVIEFLSSGTTFRAGSLAASLAFYTTI